GKAVVDVDHAAYVMQGRLPQIRRALGVVRQELAASGTHAVTANDACLDAVQRSMTGPPLDVSPALFKAVLAGWIEQGLFGLEDPTK
ncbi:MAG: hypothetical protein HKN93_06805, partial [Acidimicrobiia bacterium]|nr:hypothetical protein [Acidimicrobiia bacterium]